MMRGSCRRIWRSLGRSEYYNEYVLKLLYAFATYGLSNSYYYKEAEKYLIEGFTIFYKLNNYEKLKKHIKEFENALIESTKNNELIEYLETAKKKIMIGVNLSFAQELTNQIKIK
jgi:hypothetical protein